MLPAKNQPEEVLVRSKTTVEAVAEKAFTPANQINCSGYVKDVAHQLGVYMPLGANANDLVKYMKTDGFWTKLGNNDVEASKMAGQHYLVVAGWVNQNGHGHVVVIMPGRDGKFARASWGSLGNAGNAGENKGINWAFDPHERSEVQYFAIPVSALVTSQ
jgi:hypothetical protein